MELLTYPFHRPPNVSDFHIHEAGALDVPSITLQPSTPCEPADPSKDAQSVLHPSTSYGSSILPSDTSSHGAARANHEDDEGSIATSYTSSHFVRHANDAFTRIRTANPAEGQRGPSLPAYWRDYQAPALKQGHWRSFGPVTLRCWSIPMAGRASLAKKASKRESMTRLYPSSKCSGTVWVTGDKLVFVLEEDTRPGPVPADGKAKPASRPSVKSFLARLRKPQSMDKLKPLLHKSEPGGIEEPPLPGRVEDFPVTGVQIPLSTLIGVRHCLPASCGRTSITLSRSSSRPSPNISRRASLSKAAVQPIAIDFASQDMTDDPVKVVIDASIPAGLPSVASLQPEEQQTRLVRWELSFLSILYQQEAAELISRLKTLKT